MSLLITDNNSHSGCRGDSAHKLLYFIPHPDIINSALVFTLLSPDVRAARGQSAVGSHVHVFISETISIPTTINKYALLLVSWSEIRFGCVENAMRVKPISRKTRFEF